MGISALYPRPPQPQQNILQGNPLSIIGPALQLRQFGAQQAAGRDVQGAISGGQFDPSGALNALGNDPAAALAAPELTTRLLAARGQNIANATAAVGLQASQNAGLAQFLSGFAGKTLTPQDVNTIRAGAVRFGGDPATFGAITSPDQAAQAVKNAQIYAAGAGTTIQPTPTGPNANLAPTVTTLGEAARGGAAPGGVTGPRVVGPSGVQTADQAAYLADQAKSGPTLGNLRTLEQALPLVQGLSHYNFGPGSDDINKVKGLLTTLGITGVDPTSEIAVRQEVNKKLLQYARGARDAGRSDSSLATAIESNPNLDLTQPANLGLIKNQIGMDRQDAAIPQAAGGWNGYLNFKNRWYQATDPRGFQNMSQDDLVSLAGSAKGKPEDPNSERSRLNRSIGIARSLGITQAPGE